MIALLSIDGMAGGVALSLLFAGTAMVLQTRERHRWALLALSIAALVLRITAAFLDPFLNDWDEVFHAIVAKNMMAHPLTPMLYTETAMPLDGTWSRAHFWLHKPPFFLWQMAISLKIFGLHVWAVRLPSVLWTTLLVPVVWRMGCLLRDQWTGFVAATLATFAYLLQELASGALNTDHNDAIFIATVACSWWAWLEFVRSPTWRWAAVAGLFAACAVFTKWYIGLSVFVPWGLWVLNGKFKPERVKGLLVAGGVMLLPVLAWIAHMVRWFPVEAAHEWSYKAEHFGTAMDGHRGTAMFHLDVIADLVPPFAWWIVLPAVAWLVWQTKLAAHRIFVVSLVVAIHIFFMLAQTKMVCYTMVLFPLYAIAIGNALRSICEALPWERYRQPLLVLATMALAYFTLDPERTQARHSIEPSPLADHRWRKQALEVMHDIPQLQQFVSTAGKPVVFNMRMNHHLRYMFTTGIEAWAKLPSSEDVARLRAKGYTVFVLQDGAPQTSLPAGTRMVPDSVFAISHDMRL
ncbi:MAG: glycosyltransferase family 39 protein [Flavobacteriales bacterium]